ncbi:MAG TPA: mannosyltransferase family protein [Candidatus Acidoferrales bacterium]|nr:mannosyltransferase family protein [Candidatus Acidoferrales bacterium]
MRQLVAAFVVTRVALALVIVASLTWLTPNADTPTQALLTGLTRWDGSAYLDIARSGYEQLDRSYGAYAPLYPLLVAIGGRVLGGSSDAYIVAGVAISNIALLAALVALVTLASPRVGADGARHAGIYVLVFPTTVILSATYAEATFLAFAVASAVESERGRDARSGLFAGLAALARPFGAIAVLPLAWRLIRERRSSSRAWASVALAPLAFIAWTAYLARRQGDPLEVIRVYSAWGSAPRMPFQAVLDLFDPAVYGFPWIVLGLFALFVALAVVSWRVVGPAYGAFALTLLLVVASSGSLTSSTRYELAVYPAFIALGGVLRRPLAHAVWTILSAILAIVLTAMFALLVWIG